MAEVPNHDMVKYIHGNTGKGTRLGKRPKKFSLKRKLGFSYKKVPGSRLRKTLRISYK